MVIYLISSYNQDTAEVFYKVGVTKNSANQRIKQLQTGNANKLEVVTTFETKYAYKIEKSFHRCHSHLRLNGEWFKLDEEFKKETFINFCTKIDEYLNSELTIKN